MRTILRQLIKFTFAILLMAVTVSSTLIVMFCNTATLKPLISDQIMMLTGRNVDIQGGVHWSFFPGLAINVDHIHFIKSKYSKQTVGIDISNMKMGLRLLPLIYGKVEAGDIEATIDLTSLNSDATAHLSLSSEIRVNLHKKQYTFSDVILDVETKNNNNNMNFNITGNVIADFQDQTMTWNDFNCQSDDVALMGHLTAKNMMGSPIVTGQLRIQLSDLMKVLGAIGQVSNREPEVKGISGIIDFQYAHGLVDASGDIQVKKLRSDNINLADLNMHLAYKNHELNMTEMTTKIYGGEFSGKVKVSYAFDYPQLALEGKLANIDSGLLWKELAGDNHKINLTGMGNVTFQLKTVGNDTKKIVKNLTGTSTFELTDGYLLGADLVFWINHAFVPLNKKMVFPDKVIFSKLTGSMTVKDGIILNNDLILEMPELLAKGKGQIDLARHYVEYVLHTSVKKVTLQKVGNVQLTNTGFVPIHIKGNMTNPEVYVKNDSI